MLDFSPLGQDMLYRRTRQVAESRMFGTGYGLFPGQLTPNSTKAFSDFISGTTATPKQIEFINLIVQELTENG